MVGQFKLKATIDHLTKTGFPRFIILQGNSIGGKLGIAKYIAEGLKAHLVSSEIKVDDVREVIKLSYSQSEPTVYLFPEVDKMSISAKNALLKVTEEPPRKAYFIITLADLSSTLATLRSRGTVLTMDIYSPVDLFIYSKAKGYEFTELEMEIVRNICTTPEEVDILVSYNIIDFYGYIETVVENIGVVNGANAFKIGSKLKFKESDTGWDITLFMRSIMNIYNRQMIQDPNPVTKDCIRVTSKYLSEMSITGVTKSLTFDMWILEIRGVLA